MAKLLVHESAGAREYDIMDAEVRLGRELDNTLRLPDPSVSRHHCVIRKGADGYEIQDLESSNGILINGNRVQTSPLRDGDRITLGQVQLTFQDPRPLAPTVQEAAPAPLGTMRMSADDLKAIHAGKAPVEPPPTPLDQAATGPIPLVAPPPAPPVAPPPVQPASPEFGHFTNPGTVASPASTFLPGVPDEAQPTGERGDFFTRLVAGLIDYSPFILLQVISALMMPASVTLGGAGAGLGALAALGCLSVLLFLAYLVLVPWCWIKFGATPGKKIMKLRIVPSSNPTGRIDLGTAVLRMLGYLVNGIISWIITLPFAAMFVLGAAATGTLGRGALLLKAISLVANGVPYLLILFTAERKGLHDMIAKTIVIKVDR